ncbi:murein biosynthesis integral membrane protein MurJ [Alphaproteobacteria bacterium]|nr:murein biosynthesis integral membrane protein MurJ [Alphaproteobacteria bacterium]
MSAAPDTDKSAASKSVASKPAGYKSLGVAARQIGGLTAISRVLGFVRDIAFAIFLGAGPIADAFLVALKLPNMFRRLSAEGAFTNAFLPQFSREKNANGLKSALFLAAEIQIILTFVLVVLVVAAEIFMPTLIGLLAPGFADTPDRMAAAIALARVTMPYLPLISLVALYIAIANAHDRFGVGAAMPIILNISLIAGACLIPFMSGDMLGGTYNAPLAMPLAIAVLVAGILQLAIMYHLLRKSDLAPPFIWPRFSAAGRRMWRKFLPAAFGAAGMQLNTLVDLILASLLPVGTISWLYFADRVAQLPLGIVGIALGTALLPRLSRAEAEADHAAIPKALSEAISLGGFFIIPAVAAMIMLADHITLGLFGYGAFSEGDAAATAAALAVYALGLPGFVLIKILQTAFYASGRPGHVLTISLIMVAVNIIGSLLLMGPLGHVGLALATSLAASVAAGLMIVLLAREGKLHWRVLSPLIKPVIAALVMLAGLKLGLIGIGGMTGPFLATLPAALVLAGLVAIGGGFYFGSAVLLGALPKGVFRR